MKLNTIESDLKLHLAKKGNRTHTLTNFKAQQHTCIRVIVTPKWSEDHSIVFAVRGHSEQLRVQKATHAHCSLHCEKII